MATVEKYGQPDCATCAGRGILTDREGRPTQCVPCTSERKEQAVRLVGYSVQCNACTAVLTVADMQRLKDRPRMPLLRLHGPLCGHCITESTTGRVSA